MGDFFKIFSLLTISELYGVVRFFFSCMKISTHCTYFMTSLPIVNHIGIVNVEPMWDIDISDTPKRFVHSSRTQIFEFPVNRSDFRHHAMRDTWRLNYNHRERHRMGKRMCKCIPYLSHTAIPYRASTGPEQGFPCEVFPHREKPFFITGNPFSHYRDFPVRKTSQGKPCFHYREGFAVCSKGYYYLVRVYLNTI